MGIVEVPPNRLTLVTRVLLPIGHQVNVSGAICYGLWTFPRSILILNTQLNLRLEVVHQLRLGRAPVSEFAVLLQPGLGQILWIALAVDFAEPLGQTDLLTAH